MRPRLDVNGDRFNSHLLIILFHLLNHLTFSTGDTFWNKVVHVESREGLEHLY